MSFGFKLICQDSETKARLGKITTPHGEVETPVFVPVGTKATVKTMTPEELKEIGVQMILGNAYHLYLRPGVEIVEKMGGLHKFMHWEGPLLTDSGGFQIFSLSETLEVANEGVRFQSIIDGSTHFLTPEDVTRIQQSLGADIVMILDECPPYSAEKAQVEEAVRRTSSWAKRCQKVFSKGSQALFGIIQGGIYKDLRRQSVEKVISLGFDGYGLGGFSVGEPHQLMFEVLGETMPLLPQDKPRYLMGVGNVISLLEAISLGVDMFDSVLPTRVARNGGAFTNAGRLNIRNNKYAEDPEPLDKDCRCYACQNYSRSYLRHLYQAGEILALRLLTWHNLFFTVNLIRKAQEAIAKGKFTQLKESFTKGYGSKEPGEEEGL